MPLNRTLAAALFAAPLLTAAIANAEETIRLDVDVLGGSKCSAVLQDLKDQPTQAANAYSGWALGYMARRNVERAIANQTQVDFQKAKLGQQVVLKAVVALCSENADAPLFLVVDAFYKAMLEDSPLTS